MNLLRKLPRTPILEIALWIGVAVLCTIFMEFQGRHLTSFDVVTNILTGILVAIAWHPYRSLRLPMAILLGFLRFVSATVGVIIILQVLTDLFHWPTFSPPLLTAVLAVDVVASAIVSLVRFLHDIGLR